MKRLIAIAAVAPVLLAGCSSLPIGLTQDVTVETTGAEDARCELANAEGNWFVPTTPVSVTIRRDASPLTVTCSKEGFEDGTATIEAAPKTMSTTMLIAGGFIKRAYDKATGSDFEYPSRIFVPMQALPDSRAATSAAGDGPGGNPEIVYEALVAGDYIAAEEELEKILAANAGDAFAQYNMGIVYEKTERYDEAREMYASVVNSAAPDVMAGSAEGERPLLEFARSNLARLSGMQPPPSVPQISDPGFSTDGEQEASLAPERPGPPDRAREGFTGTGIHLASFRNRANADLAWSDLNREHGDLLQDLEPHVVRVNLGEKGIFYRLIAGTVPSQDQARGLCRAFKSRDQWCQVMNLE